METNEINKFKKGDYIVCLNEPNTNPKNGNSDTKGGAGFKANYCLIVRDTSNNVLWFHDHENGVYFNSVRLATPQEIAEYERLGKPFDVTTLKPTFEVGKWYKLDNWISKFLRLDEDKFYAENINTQSKFHDKNGFLPLTQYTPILITDLSEIQQYLPEGHPDKIKVNKNTDFIFIPNSYYVGTWHGDKRCIFKTTTNCLNDLCYLINSAYDYKKCETGCCGGMNIDFRKATIQEINHLNQCIEANKYVEYDELITSTNGLNIGDLLDEKVICAWANEDFNYYGSKEKWVKKPANFCGNRKILSFKRIDGIIGFEVSGTSKVFLKAEGFVKFRDNFKMKEIQEECKRRFPIGSKVNTKHGGEHIIIDDKGLYTINDDQIWSSSGKGCLYFEGKYADLISLPEEWIPKVGDWVVLISGRGKSNWVASMDNYVGKCVQLIELINRDYNYFKIKDNSWSWEYSNEIKHFRKALPHEIPTEIIPVESQIPTDFILPKNWCVKVIDQNRDTLDKWRKTKNPLISCTLNFWLVSDSWSDGTWCSYSTNCPDGYTEITFEQFQKYVLKETTMYLNNDQLKFNEVYVAETSKLEWDSLFQAIDLNNHKEVKLKDRLYLNETKISLGIGGHWTKDVKFRLPTQEEKIWYNDCIKAAKILPKNSLKEKIITNPQKQTLNYHEKITRIHLNIKPVVVLQSEEFVKVKIRTNNRIKI